VRAVVIGGGIAGTAAAWAARRAGWDVTVVFDRPGASALYSGALDIVPWELRPLADPEHKDERELQLFATALEAWTFGPGPCRVATFDGVVRSTRAIDSALLDLSPLAGKKVELPETPLEHFDARSLARSLASSAWAKDTRTRFGAVPVPALFETSLRRAPAYDVASLSDDESFLYRLAGALTAASPSSEAWLLGPWLGTRAGVAGRLRALLGVSCGETTSPPGGPAGARFEAARDGLLAGAGITAHRERVDSLAREAHGWRVRGGPELPDTPYDAAVLATGGVCAGGLVFGSSTFRPSIDVAVTIGLEGRQFDGASLRGGLPWVADPSALLRLGILADHGLARGGNGLIVAGDCVEGRPRTALEAARAGIAATRLLRSS
jgi:glycerol-3-phosphate dehydrogenase subunit B